jgi:hypothetical protein
VEDEGQVEDGTMDLLITLVNEWYDSVQGTQDLL